MGKPWGWVQFSGPLASPLEEPRDFFQLRAPRELPRPSAERGLNHPPRLPHRGLSCRLLRLCQAEFLTLLPVGHGGGRGAGDSAGGLGRLLSFAAAGAAQAQGVRRGVRSKLDFTPPGCRCESVEGPGGWGTQWPLCADQGVGQLAECPGRSHAGQPGAGAGGECPPSSFLLHGCHQADGSGPPGQRSLGCWGC